MTFIETTTSLRRKRPYGFSSINGYRSVSPEPIPKKLRTEYSEFQREELSLGQSTVPEHQNVLLLHGKGQRYELEDDYAVPQVRTDRELLVKIQYIGLNPIDWKSADFGFGIPELPYIAGRDFAGTVVQESRSDSRFKRGDVVFTASTDYRDLRKAAYQQYAVASNFNLSRVPKNVSREQVTGMGVAFVAAILALGVCLGCDFNSANGPSLTRILNKLAPEALPMDVRDECLQGISESERPAKGDWILIWGGSSTSANILAQLAKLIGLRVIKVLDVGKHGAQFSQGPADLLVDGHNTGRAVEIIRRVTGGNLRFAVDTISGKTADLSRRCLWQGGGGKSSHLVGLSGLPKDLVDGVKHHNVPIKVYHEVPEVGDILMIWLEGLLKEGKLSPPETEVTTGGMEGINNALDRMRKGEVSGKRVVVRL